MDGLFDLIILLIVGGAGLIQWLQQRKRHARPQPSSNQRSARRLRPAVARRVPTPVSARPAPARPAPFRPSQPPPARPSPYDERDHAEAEAPQDLTLENVLSELFGGEPVQVPPRPPARVPLRRTPPPPPPLPEEDEHEDEQEEAPLPLVAAVPEPTPAPAPPPPAAPAPNMFHALRGLHGTDWQLAVVMQELLGPPVGLR